MRWPVCSLPWGFDGLDDEVFRDLVIARVVEPTSLLDAGRVLRDLARSVASYAAMKRTLGRAAAGKYRDRIATWCFRHASTGGHISLVLYDVTTLYFEAEKEDELRRAAIPRNAASIRRSSSVCSLTEVGSR
jgi:hypothetical protein